MTLINDYKQLIEWIEIINNFSSTLVNFSPLKAVIYKKIKIYFAMYMDSF